MKPSHTRLICRAHNRFTPSIVLWQHFIGPHQHILPQQRFSSTASESAQDAAGNVNGVFVPPEASGLSQMEAELGCVEVSQMKIRKKSTSKGTWYSTKADVSKAKNVSKQYAARQASLTAPEKLLSIARAAFEAAEEYDGVVVQPMINPVPIKERNLPWCLPAEEATMSGIDRLGVEIGRFYEYSKPNYYEALARRHVIEQVRHHVRKTLPDHILEVFGSERTGLALATSDIDFRLLTKKQLEDPALAKLPPTPEQRTEAMKHLHKLYFGNLSKHKAYLLPSLRYARYPLISLQDRQSGLDVQIVLSNDTSLSRAVVQGYMEEYPYLRQLHFVIKTMFDVRGLSDVFRGGFGSYSLFMMIVASIKHKPHPRNDAAGALINFLKFYRSFDTKKQGISVEPALLFDKSKELVMPDKVKHKLEEGASKPLPPYMLCLRDPADETNDLGRKGIAIKHVQATFRKLCFDLDRDLALNTRPSHLGNFVGSSYMLNKERRERLRHYGYRLSHQLKTSLAAKAKMIRDREQAEEANKESEEEKEKARLAREEKDKEFRRLAEVRNERLQEEAGRTAVLDHGDAIASILGMPSVEDDARTKTSQDKDSQRLVEESSDPKSNAEMQTTTEFLVAEPNSDAEKRSLDVTLAEDSHKSKSA